MANESETAAELDGNPRFFDLVGQVRSMRRLKPDPVPLETLRKLLETGVQAPSGMNTQPWAFLVLHEAESRAWFAQRYGEAIRSRFGEISGAGDGSSPMARQARTMVYQVEHMHEFPLIVLVCGERDWPFRVPPHERVGLAPPNYGAVYPCVQNILLACRSLGLGAALTTMHQVFEEEMQRHFGIPEKYGVVVAMPIGYPMGRFGPVTRKPAADVTYFDRWSNLEPGDWG